MPCVDTIYILSILLCQLVYDSVSTSIFHNYFKLSVPPIALLFLPLDMHLSTFSTKNLPLVIILDPLLTLNFLHSLVPFNHRLFQLYQSLENPANSASSKTSLFHWYCLPPTPADLLILRFALMISPARGEHSTLV